MKLLTLIGGVSGAALAVWLLHRFGLGNVLALLHQAGWGLLLVIGFHLVQVVFSGAAWRAIAGRGAPSLAQFVLLRWVREAVNNLLPVAQIGGELVCTRLLRRRGMSLTRAAACTVCDLTAETVTQILFTLTGLLALLGLLGRSRVTDEVLGGLGVACIGAVVLVGGQWFGLASLLERGLAGLAARFGWQGMGEIGGLQDAIIGLYRSPRGVTLALLYQMIAWLLGSVEICVALHVLGHDVGLAQGLVIESLSQAVKAAGFAVPASLGVSEGGFIMVGALFGLSPQISIALALVKRLREIALGLPALASWQWLERRPLPQPALVKPALAKPTLADPHGGGALEFGDAS